MLFFLLFSIHTFSQNIQGKIYDDEATVSGVKVINQTKNILTYSDEYGNFKIEASLKDSIVFRSLFHHQKQMVLSAFDFEDILVIELKKAVNDLDEVLIKKEPDVKPFDPVETNTTMKNQILEDIRKNPHLYSKSTNGNMDFKAIAKLIGKLFKSKKPIVPSESNVPYDELVSFFEKDAYFNVKLLKNELHITEDYKYLFLQYCDANGINSKLLLVENRFLLLDSLLKYSEAFLEIINSDQKD